MNLRARGDPDAKRLPLGIRNPGQVAERHGTPGDSLLSSPSKPTPILGGTFLNFDTLAPFASYSTFSSGGISISSPDGLIGGDLAAALGMAIGSGLAVGLQLTIYNPDFDESGANGRGLATTVNTVLSEFA